MSFGIAAAVAGGAVLGSVMGSDGPDTSGMNQAAVDNAAISKETLEWYKKVYADSAPQRELAAKTANDVAQQQLATSKQNDAISNDYWNYQKNTFRPLEGGIVADAQNYDTAARRNQAAGRAMADVEQQFGNEAAQQQRAMTRMGVNPSSGKFAAMSTQMAMAQAAAKAGAASKARDNVELQGYARKMDAANMGRGLASSQATSAGVALNAGNNAVNNAGTPLTQANNAMATMGQGFGTAIQGNNSAGNLYGQAAQIAGKDSGLMGALGGIAGQFAGSSAGSAWLAGLSDKNKKTNIKPVSDEQALDAVKSTPVSKWDYKPGAGDGGTHIGPMAQDVNRSMGEQAAPGGKVLDLVTMNGMNMAATAALARKVDKLSAKIKGAKA